MTQGIGLDASMVPELGPGESLRDRYRIDREVGQGGMAKVYLARDEHLDGRQVAIKMVPAVLMQDERYRQSLKREAQLVMDLRHERIRAVFNLEEDPARGAAFVVMEYIDGASLDHVLASRPDEKMTEDEVVVVARQACEALAYAHGKGVIHRDVKPKNLFLEHIVGESGLDPAKSLPLDKISLKVVDFGLGMAVREGVREQAAADTSASGTLLYMAPEQIRGESETPAVDVYALGATLYELLAGHPPFRKGDIREQIQRLPPRPIEGISPWLWSVLAACLEKDVARRPKQARDVLRLLDAREAKPGVAAPALDAPAAPAARPASPPAAPPRQALPPRGSASPRRDEPSGGLSKALVAIGAVVALGAVGVGVLLFARRPAPEPASVASPREGSAPAVAPPPATSTESNPSAADVVEKYVEARGGLPRLREVSTLRRVGELLTASGSAIPVVAESQRPSSFRVEYETPQGPVVRGYDGARGWRQSGGGVAEAVSGPELATMAAEADFEGPLVDHGAKGHRVELVGKDLVEARPAWKLKVTLRTGETEYHYLDAATYLPVKVVQVRRDGGKTTELESVYGDYRTAGGVLWPHSAEFRAPGRGSQRFTFTSIEVNQALDSSRFALPE